jgi:hypothetical protein
MIYVDRLDVEDSSFLEQGGHPKVMKYSNVTDLLKE